MCYVHNIRNTIYLGIEWIKPDIARASRFPIGWSDPCDISIVMDINSGVIVFDVMNCWCVGTPNNKKVLLVNDSINLCTY